MNWLQEGDIGTKYFFKLIEAKQEKERIGPILDNGSLSDDPSFMKHSFYSFHQLFYTNQNNKNREARDFCLKMIPKKVGEEDAKMLEKDLSLQEIESTISVGSLCSFCFINVNRSMLLH